MDLLVGGVRRLSESRKKSRSLPLSSRSNPPNFSLASFEDDGSSSFAEQSFDNRIKSPPTKVKRKKRRSSCLPLPKTKATLSSNFRGSRDSSEDEIGQEGTSNSDTSCSSVEFLRVHSACANKLPVAFDEIIGSGNSFDDKGSRDSLSRKERLEALKARIAAERERVRDSSDEELRLRQIPLETTPKTKLGIWRFHSDEALNRGGGGFASGHHKINKTRAARTERYLKRKSQEDVSLKHVTHSDPNLDFLEYTAPPSASWLLTPRQVTTSVAEISPISENPIQEQSPTISTSSPNPVTWKESHAYEEPKIPPPSSLEINSSKEQINLPKKMSSPSRNSTSSSNVQQGGGHSFLPSRKPSPLTVRTVFGSGSPFSMMAQPSPCDSGLSSQSMTSSPSIGRAPTPPPRIVKGNGGNTRPQRPASCALSSPTTENLYGRIISRSPTSTLQSECGGSSSGRSSPWWHRVNVQSPGNSNKPPVKPNNAKTVQNLYYYTDVPPTKQIYSYTDQAPAMNTGSFKSTCSDTSSAYMSDSQLDSKRSPKYHIHQSSPSFFPVKQANTTTPPTSPPSNFAVYSVSRPSSLFNYSSGLKSPPINQNGRPLSMVLEKSESLESSINNGPRAAVKSKEVKSPPATPPRKVTPTSTLQVQTPRTPTFDMSSEEKERRRRTSENFEDALQELEQIYQSLGLNDEDLLDRAERRDLPTLHQLKRFSIADPMALQVNGGFPLSRSSSEGFYRSPPNHWDNRTNPENAHCRTPPNRRSAIPDKISDDLAIRRLQRTPSSASQQPCKSPGGPGMDTKQSYLQCSPALTPTPTSKVFNAFFPQYENNNNSDEPDVNLDDVTYRKYTQADSVKVPPVHPPFGIPLEPVTKCSPSDYLHATPSDDDKKRARVNFYKPEANPDVIRDDMAFRNLRRQSKPNGIGPLDAACQEVEAWRKPPRRKDRAVKSLSANMDNFAYETYDSILNGNVDVNGGPVIPLDNDKAQSMSDLIAALEKESKKWEAFVKETEVTTNTDSNKINNNNLGSSTETLTELSGHSNTKQPVKIISLPEPIKGKSGAIYSLMCLSDIKKRKEDKNNSNNIEKSKSPPPVPKRTSTIILTKRPPHPKGFWSDSETRSFGDDILMTPSLNVKTGEELNENMVTGSNQKCDFVTENNAFLNLNLNQSLSENPHSASSHVENATLPAAALPNEPNSLSAHQETPPPKCNSQVDNDVMSAQTLNSYGVKSTRSNSTTTATNNRFISNTSSPASILGSSNPLDLNKPRSDSMPSTLSSVNPDRVAKIKEERRKLHQARFNEAKIKFEPETNALGTEPQFFRRSLRQSNKTTSSDIDGGIQQQQEQQHQHQDTTTAESALLSSQQPPSSRRRFIKREPSESSDTGTLPPTNNASNPGLVRSTRASRLRAQAASVSSNNVPQIVKNNSDSLSRGTDINACSRKITPSDSDVPRVPSSSANQKSITNDLNDNLTASKNIAGSGSLPKIGQDDVGSDASEVSSLGKAKDKSGKRKSNLNRANVLDEPRPIPSEAHEAARVRSRRIRRTSESSQTSGSDKLDKRDNPFARSASLRVNDVTKTNITERLSLLTPRVASQPINRKGSSSDSPGETCGSLTKKRESTDKTLGSLSASNKSTDLDSSRRVKPWALKKPDIPEVLKVQQRHSPVPSPTSFISTLNQVPKSTPNKLIALKEPKPVLVESIVKYVHQSSTTSTSVESHGSSLTSTDVQVLDDKDKAIEQANSSNDDIFATPPDRLSRDNTVSPTATSGVLSSEVVNFVPFTSVLKGSSKEASNSVVEKLSENVLKTPILKRRSIDEEPRDVICSSILRPLRSPPEETVPVVVQSEADKKPSILKKRGSSEEKESSDQAIVHPILKKHSIDETGSPVHSILKNRTSLEDLDVVTGAQSDQVPKPILKKRYSQEELVDLPGLRNEPKKPILKKKGDEDNWDEKPKPILKSRRSLDEPSTALDVLGLNRKYESCLQESAIRSILKKSVGSEAEESDVDNQSKPSILKSKSVLPSSSLYPNRRNSEDAIVSDSCLVTLNRPSNLAFQGRRGSVDTDNRYQNQFRTNHNQSPVHFQPLPSILKRKNSAEVELTSKIEPDTSLGLEKNQPAKGVVPRRGGLKVTDGVGPSHVLRERFNRRNAPRYRTQPVTQVEVEETDSLESVQAFRALIMKKASLNVFEQGHIVPKVTPVVPTRPLEPEVLGLVKPEYPKPYRSERKKRFDKRQDRRNNARYRTLPITVEELAEAEKAEAGRTNHSSESSDNHQEGQSEGVHSSSSDELVKLSVAAKASLFQQKAEEVKASAEPRRLSGGDSSVRNRFLMRRSLTRSQTQPVTEEEVHEAAKIGKVEATIDEKTTSKEELASPTEEPSKLSLVEKMKLFTQKSKAEIEAEKPELIRGPSIRRSRGNSSRFRTQPITTEEVQKASGLSKSGSKGGLAACILKSAKELSSKNDSSIPSTHDVQQELKSLFSTPTSSQNGANVAALSSQSGSNRSSVANEKIGGNSPKTVTKVVAKQEAKMSTSESSSSSEESAESSGDEDDLDESKTVLAGGQSHIVINQMTGSNSPAMPKKITNLAVQRKYNSSMRQKEERKSVESHNTEREEVEVTTKGRSFSSSDTHKSKYSSKDEKKQGPQRSLTQPVLMAADLEKDAKKGSIADRLAALQRSGTEDWQKRICKVKPETPKATAPIPNPIRDEQTPSTPTSIEKSASILALKSKLEESATQWKQRVEEKDAVKFTVAGKMGHPLATVQTPGNGGSTPGSRGQTPHTTPVLDRKKKMPTPVAFSSSKAKITNDFDGISSSVKGLPQGISPLVKSKSMPVALKDLSSDDDSSSDETDSPSSRVLVPKADNETFSSFFDSRLVQRIQVDRSSSTSSQTLVISEDVFKEVASQSHQMLVQKRTVQKQRRKHAATTRNPIKALASRTDLQQEYTEVKSGIAEKEVKRLQIEQLAKSSSKCLSALAGLASTEDFKSVSLRKGTIEASPLLPHSDVMLVQVKGRRHVQTRLVEATSASVNSGDSYVLITPEKVICYVGEFTNVIERAKVTEVASVIQQKKDLCFKGNAEVILIDNEKNADQKQVAEFFELLGTDSKIPCKAGPPHEDEIYETEVISTNKVYTLKDDALVPLEGVWGCLPKIEILDSQEIVVFDFGSEFYVWNGKQAPFEKRKSVARLAKELFDQGYDYSECDINPLCPRMPSEDYKPTLADKSSSRPSWVVFAKINQHMEPVLFREKFSDWPDLTRIIKVKGQDEECNKTESIADLKAFDAREMFNWQPEEPDLCLEGSHLGRGLEYYDEEERRNFEIVTTSVDVWHILEYERQRLVPESHGQFHCGDTYVVRWNYTLMQIGRDFYGNVSKHSFTGRSRCAYFFWQGKNSRITEKGASALMTVELDEERGPQVRVVQGKESPCFLNVFEGRMVVYLGERECAETNTPGPWKLFMVRGEFPSEAMLVEVNNGCQSLRSRGSFVLVNVQTGIIFQWHGSKCHGKTKKVADKAVENILDKRPEEMMFSQHLDKFVVKVTEEGKETKEFWSAIGGKKRRNYFSLSKSILSYDYTPRLFRMTSINGVFEASEIFCSYGTTKHACAYPFLQSDIYGVPQPALFLLDNNSEVFLWQGWWPEGDEETVNVATGSANQRFNMDRRCAMETTLEYCRVANESKPPKAYVIHAGREPLVFTNLFPEWETVQEVVRVSSQNEALSKQRHPCLVQDVLGKLERKYYKLEELRAQPLPEGVNPSNLEIYLDDNDFFNVFQMSKDEFKNLASWKRTNLKKEAQLF